MLRGFKMTLLLKWRFMRSKHNSWNNSRLTTMPKEKSYKDFLKVFSYSNQILIRPKMKKWKSRTKTCDSRATSRNWRGRKRCLIRGIPSTKERLMNWYLRTKSFDFRIRALLVKSKSLRTSSQVSQKKRLRLKPKLKSLSVKPKNWWTNSIFLLVNSSRKV
jgi:hypothetical protein